MKKTNRITFLSAFLIIAYILSACSGVPANVKLGQNENGQSQQVVFTGTVEAMGAGEWTISGQAITVDGTTKVDANIVVGDNVKVEAVVDQNGTVTAVTIELAVVDNANGNDNANANTNDANTNDVNANDNSANGNENMNDNDANSNENDNDADEETEIFGVVEAMDTGSITIDGVQYAIADFTEFKDLIAVGDQVKAHVIDNGDGTFTIREIEKVSGTGMDDGNSNGSDDDQSNLNTNSNTNGDDNGGNSNDNNGSDDNGNSNSNGNGND